MDFCLWGDSMETRKQRIDRRLAELDEEQKSLWTVVEKWDRGGWVGNFAFSDEKPPLRLSKYRKCTNPKRNRELVQERKILQEERKEEIKREALASIESTEDTREAGLKPTWNGSKKELASVIRLAWEKEERKPPQKRKHKDLTATARFHFEKYSWEDGYSFKNFFENVRKH